MILPATPIQLRRLHNLFAIRCGACQCDRFFGNSYNGCGGQSIEAPYPTTLYSVGPGGSLSWIHLMVSTVPTNPALSVLIAGIGRAKQLVYRIRRYITSSLMRIATSTRTLLQLYRTDPSRSGSSRSSSSRRSCKDSACKRIECRCCRN